MAGSPVGRKSKRGSLQERISVRSCKLTRFTRFFAFRSPMMGPFLIKLQEIKRDCCCHRQAHTLIMSHYAACKIFNLKFCNTTVYSRYLGNVTVLLRLLRLNHSFYTIKFSIKKVQVL